MIRRAIGIRHLHENSLGLDPQDLRYYLFMDDMNSRADIEDTDHQSHVTLPLQKQLRARLPLADMPASQGNTPAGQVSHFSRRKLGLFVNLTRAQRHFTALDIAVFEPGVVGIAFFQGIEQAKLQRIHFDFARNHIHEVTDKPLVNRILSVRDAFHFEDQTFFFAAVKTMT